ncbi:SGNH/GDSL hydrolase family protein [Roseomonas sp. HJA6]|uniref:SGNH/GDSL hydrolase family protein n=1 Tax=Roseomonas alba TaxID=2846776 RepID=A0ABS7A698_9PROT|nr:GDSL-type esterase/lipase family protein [Neoroseomonas alba]MBW6397826.1 SGNH/GDSL hydrolase family protein [Neoroseomonas alba]
MPGSVRPETARYRALLVGVLLALPGVTQAGAASCPQLSSLPIESPALIEASRQGSHALRIVAFGSSSTAGSGASDTDHAYPALLQARLRAALGPGVTVMNQGVGGEDADNMLARLDRDVIAEHPQIVIWQVGANAAMRRMDPVRFAGFVREGVARLRQAGIEVVLMDNQRAPRIAAFPNHERFDAALAEIAASTPGVTLFSRGRMMDRWAAAGVPGEALLGQDGLHHNDRGYACLADALADALLNSLPTGLAHAR